MCPVKYANEMTDDANLQRRPLKFGSSTGNTRTAIKNSVPMATPSFPVSTYSIFNVTDFQFQNRYL